MSSLVRTVSESEKRPKRARRANRVLRVPLGLQRYINKRGTPGGVYELVCSVSGTMAYTSGGIAIGAGNYEAGTFVVTPQNLQFVSGVPGNSNTVNIANAAEISALWDKIKIDKVEMTFTTSAQGAPNTVTQQPMWGFCTDDNDTNTSVQQMQQMGDYKVWVSGNQSDGGMYKVTFRLKYQRFVYYTALTSGYEPTSGYVVSDTAIPHYGLKVCLASNLGATGLLQYNAKIYFKCKELK